MNTRLFLSEENQHPSEDDAFIDTDWPAKPLKAPVDIEKVQKAARQKAGMEIFETMARIWPPRRLE